MTAKKTNSTNAKKLFIIWYSYDTNEYDCSVSVESISAEEALKQYISGNDPGDTVYYICPADGSEKPMKFKFGLTKL